MPDRPLIEIVRAAVAEIAPDELPDFDFVARAYAEAPRAAARARRGRSESTASAYTMAGQAVVTLATAVGADLCKDALLFGARKAGRRLSIGWARLRGRDRIDLDSVPPPVPEPELARLEDAAIAAAREHGATDELATSIGAALVRQWPRPS
jgi:hypothetical protein